MNFLRRPGPSSLPKGLFPAPKVQTVVANAWHATSSAAKDVFKCLKCLQDLSTFETVILQESHLLHWWLLLAMQPKQCREDGHRSCRWNGSQETIGYLNTKSFHVSLVSSSTLFAIVSLFVCSFNNTKLHVAPSPPVGPSWSCNKFVTFNGPPRKDRTNLEQQQRWKARGRLPAKKMFPFKVGFLTLTENLHENPRLHGEISKIPSEH